MMKNLIIYTYWTLWPKQNNDINQFLLFHLDIQRIQKIEII